MLAEVLRVDVLHVRLVLNADTGRIACLPARVPLPAPAPPIYPAKTPEKTGGKKGRRNSAATPDLTPLPPPTPELTLKPLTLPGSSLEWLLDTVAHTDSESSQRKLLGSLICHHWHRRCFSPGAVAVMPLLGRRVLLEVCHHCSARTLA
jgi:hypothetical protein